MAINGSLTIAFPHPPGIGGPGSFQMRFEKSLISRGYRVIYSFDAGNPDIVIVIGGTKRLGWLHKMRKRNIPVIYRLDGINWLHRKVDIKLKHWVFAEYRNLNNKLIHAFFSDFIIYQSKFVQKWWEQEGLIYKKNFAVINNGINLFDFKSSKKEIFDLKLVCLEGTLDYSPYAIELLNHLREVLHDDIKIIIYGKFINPKNISIISKKIEYKGPITRDKVSKVFQGAIYLSLDINPACPNTILEALASSAPVVAYNTGAISELIDDTCGAIVSYGSDPWKLGMPDVNAMCQAIYQISSDYERYSKGARNKAEKFFDIDQTVEKYISVINRMIK